MSEPFIVHDLVESTLTITVAPLSFIALITSSGRVVSPFRSIVIMPSLPFFVISEAMSDQLLDSPYIEGLDSLVTVPEPPE